jgi:vacuolar-type H+-ATPase subunit C/Vma6
MSVWGYRHVTPYLAAKRSLLFSRDELYELAERNLNFLVTRLMDTPYRREIDAMYSQRMEALSLEDALLRHFTNSVLDAVSFAPKPIVRLVRKYVEKFEVDALKGLIKVIVAGVDSGDAFNYVLPSGRFDKGRCGEILERAGGLSDLAELVVDTDYSFTIYRNLGEVEDMRLVFLLESELTKNYYEELWEAAGRVRGLDGEIIRDLVGLEVTAVNVKVLLRYLAAGYGGESVGHYLVIVPEVLGLEALREAAQSTSVDGLITVMKNHLGHLGYDYGYMLEAVAEEYSGSQSVSRLEYVMDKSMLLSSQLMMKRHTPYFNSASLMAYINAKWYEFRNIRAILHGISSGLPASQIKGELIIV